jgi:hypothetical protein
VLARWDYLAEMILRPRCPQYSRGAQGAIFVIDATVGDTHYFLKAVAGKISDDAYCSLTQLDGFMFPNDEISVIQISRVIEEARFPSEDVYEYAYAINTCGQDGLRRLDPYLLFAVSAIFLYCNKREPLGAPHECEFLRNMIATSVEISERTIDDACVRFMRDLSCDLNEQSSRQECFSGAALAFALEALGIAPAEDDQRVTNLARIRMKGAHPYDVTLTPEELDWWRYLGDQVESSEQRARLLDMIPVS